MKKHLVLLFMVFASFVIYAQIKKKVLFIGNSYTYSNNLPQLITDIALSKSDTVVYDTSTPGGYTFQMHCTNSATWQKIRSQKWDVVVLQAQSQEPSFSPSQVLTQTYPYAKQLCDSIRASSVCTEIMFFMTWGRKNGDMSYCSAYPQVCTYNGMQARLRESYMQFKDSNMASVAPVGVAWKNFISGYPLIDLYTPDESHPSLHGSYLTACVFYSSIFKKTAVGSTYNPSLPIADVSNIQFITSQTVLDSTDVWNLGSTIPKADFSYIINPPFTGQFTNTSKNSTTFQWSFGNTAKSPSYTFPGAGTYTIQLKAKNGCMSDSISKTIMFSGMHEFSDPEFVDVVYNNNQLKVNLNSNNMYYNIQVFSIDGKFMINETGLSNGSVYLFHKLNPGIYLLKICLNTQSFIKKILITEN